MQSENRFTAANNVRKREPEISQNDQSALRAKLLARCAGAPIQVILTEIANDVRAFNGLWAAGKAGHESKPVVEISVHGRVAYGENGPRACRKWLAEASKPAGRMI